MSRSLISSLSSPKKREHLAGDHRAADDHRCAVRIEWTKLPPLGQRHRRQSLQLFVECLRAQLEAVHLVAVVLLETEGEPCNARERSGDADRGASVVTDLVGHAF